MAGLGRCEGEKRVFPLFASFDQGPSFHFSKVMGQDPARAAHQGLQFSEGQWPAVLCQKAQQLHAAGMCQPLKYLGRKFTRKKVAWVFHVKITKLI